MISSSSLCHALGIFCRFVYFLSFGFKASLDVVPVVVAVFVAVVVVVFVAVVVVCCCCRRVTTSRKHFAGIFAVIFAVKE